LINVQPNIDQTTFLTRSFLEIKTLWEAFANDHDLEVSGYLNPYGVSIDLTGTIHGYAFTIHVHKRLENTRGWALSLRPVAYSNIVTISASIPTRSTRRVRMYRRSNILNALANVVRPWKTRRRAGKINIFANEDIDMRAAEHIADQGLYFFSLTRDRLYYKRIEQMVSRERLDELMDAMLKVMK